jgi:hypothetical protein
MNRGVTVIEVLFAIGIVVIGVLGVIALLPVAGYQVGLGLMADRSAAVGVAAAQEFDIRGMRQQEMWVVHSSSGPWTFANYRSQLEQLFGQDLTPPMAFCIDPRFVAVNLGNNGSGYDARLFPYYQNSMSGHASGLPIPTDPAQPRMVRITLRTAPGSGVAMTALQTEQVFVTHDDLVFEHPDDRTLPPVQNFGSAGPDEEWGTADDVITKRQYEGTVSWMATVAPKLDLVGNFRDLYTLSIVVFNRRSSAMEMDAFNERIAFVNLPTDFYSGGYSGGDVLLSADVGPSGGQEEAQAILEVREREWVMLGGTRRSTSGSVIPVFKWYRVLAADPNVEPSAAGGNLWTREVTLQGPDWDYSYNSTWDLRTPQVTLMKGVVAVYEKTIRLETTSLW